MTIRNSDFNYICDMVRKHSAIVLEPGKEYLVESRLNPLARQEGFSSLQHMVDCLRSSPSGDLRRKVVEAMTTNETSFFREMRVFDMFRKAILPKLLVDRTRERSLNLWCAACSTGQEPYSLAMLPAGTLAAGTTIATYAGPQVTYTAGAARTIILIDPPLVTTPGIKVITANDFDPPGTID